MLNTFRNMYLYANVSTTILLHTVTSLHTKPRHRSRKSDGPSETVVSVSSVVRNDIESSPHTALTEHRIELYATTAWLPILQQPHPIGALRSAHAILNVSAACYRNVQHMNASSRTRMLMFRMNMHSGIVQCATLASALLHFGWTIRYSGTRRRSAMMSEIVSPCVCAAAVV